MSTRQQTYRILIVADIEQAQKKLAELGKTASASQRALTKAVTSASKETVTKSVDKASAVENEKANKAKQALRRQQEGIAKFEAGVMKQRQQAWAQDKKYTNEEIQARMKQWAATYKLNQEGERGAQIKARARAQASDRYGVQTQIDASARQIRVTRERYKQEEALRNLNLAGEREAQRKSIEAQTAGQKAASAINIRVRRQEFANQQYMTRLNLEGEREAQRKSIEAQTAGQKAASAINIRVRRQEFANQQYMTKLNLEGERQAQIKKMNDQKAADAQARRDQIARERQLNQRAAERRRRLRGETPYNVADDITQVGTGVYLLKRALSTLAVFETVKQLVDMSDAAKSVENRLRNLTSSEEELNSVQRALRSTADETRTEFAGTAEIYSRMAFATKGLGYSQQQLLDVTKSLNQSVAISGARSQEAKAALIQFSQALGSNRLSGDEFRSVSEQLPFVMKVIADSVGVPIGQLKKMAREGKLTTKVVIDAFEKAGDKIQTMFDKVKPTIESAFEVFKNRMLYFVTGMDKAVDANTRLAEVILLLSRNMDTLARSIATVSLTVALFFGGKALVSGFIALLGWVSQLIPSIRLFTNLVVAAAREQITWRSVMTSMPKLFGGVAFALVAVAAAVLVFSDRIIINKKTGTSWRDFWVSAIDTLRDRVTSLAERFSDLTTSYKIMKEVAANYAPNESNASVAIGPLQMPSFSGTEELMVKVAKLMDIPLKIIPKLKLMWELGLAAMAEKTDNFADHVVDAIAKIPKMVLRIIQVMATLWPSVLGLDELKGSIDKVFNGLVKQVDIIANDSKMTGEFKGAGEAWKEAIAKGFDTGPGPVEKFVTDTLHKADMTAAERARAKLYADLNTPGKVTPVAPTETELSRWDKYIEKLQDEVFLLRMLGSERDKAIQKELFQAQKENKGKPLSKEQTAQVTGLAGSIFDLKAIEAVEKDLKKLREESAQLQILDNNERQMQKVLLDAATAAQRDLTAAEADQLRDAEQTVQWLTRRNALYDEIVKPRQDLKQQEQDVMKMFLQGTINADQMAQKVRSIRQEMSALDNTVRGGITNALDRMRERANDLGKSVSDLVVASFDGLTEAIKKFAETGKIGIRDLMDLLHSLSLQLLELATNQLWAYLLKAGTSVLVSQTGGTSAGGGTPWQPPTDTTINLGANRRAQGTGVGTQSSGQTVVPAPEVHVYNIMDPRDIPAAIDSPAGRKAIMNVMSRNPALMSRLAGAQ